MELSSLVNLLIFSIVLCILSSLAVGLYYLVTDRGKTKRTAWALAIRITLSLLLFVMLVVAFLSGWITPHAPFSAKNLEAGDKDK